MKPMGPQKTANLKSLALSDCVEQKLQEYFEHLDGQIPACNLHASIIAQVEKPLVKMILKRSGGNKVQASEMLGISRNTLMKKIKDYKL